MNNQITYYDDETGIIIKFPNELINNTNEQEDSNVYKTFLREYFLNKQKHNIQENENIHKLFDKILYHKNIHANNKLNFKYTLNKLFELQGIMITHIMDQDEILKNDKIWNVICNELNIPYYPSI
ncbi:hypothetical protein QKU48_gp1170 [Fadolivirus algeromassiliense]|jgi:hypothetical protein|uniref:Uncharacterized protein n=1 Tax=Fadolivirus FV1/VV64 TaxID=3070911 RepID=A0A7D3UQQ7_9VIRU|nr:hypothetical protein QKU48_gp1170 [Fadolivirus algeromassiliense]QKF94628.1 hypothetical protein Fadolivirus_1_1170 [Fadolivirus FV1/VV64]